MNDNLKIPNLAKMKHDFMHFGKMFSGSDDPWKKGLCLTFNKAASLIEQQEKLVGQQMAADPINFWRGFVPIPKAIMTATDAAALILQSQTYKNYLDHPPEDQSNLIGDGQWKITNLPPLEERVAIVNLVLHRFCNELEKIGIEAMMKAHGSMVFELENGAGEHWKSASYLEGAETYVYTGMQHLQLHVTPTLQ